MYAVEDQLIGKISTWRRELGRLEARLARGSAMPMWENSKLLREFGSSTLSDRLLGQLTAFVLVSLIGTLIPLEGIAKHNWGWHDWRTILYALLDLIMLVMTFTVLTHTYSQRRLYYQSISTEPGDQQCAPTGFLAGTSIGTTALELWGKLRSHRATDGTQDSGLHRAEAGDMAGTGTRLRKDPDSKSTPV
jgi:hypothetical protein